MSQLFCYTNINKWTIVNIYWIIFSLTVDELTTKYFSQEQWVIFSLSFSWINFKNNDSR